jgi:hypothetical protein
VRHEIFLSEPAMRIGGFLGQLQRSGEVAAHERGRGEIYRCPCASVEVGVLIRFAQHLPQQMFSRLDIAEEHVLSRQSGLSEQTGMTIADLGGQPD